MSDLTKIDWNSDEAVSPVTKDPEGNVGTAADRNWDEDAGHENGNYSCRCVACNAHFVGHKRRVLCKLCAQPAASPVAKGETEESQAADREDVWLYDARSNQEQRCEACYEPIPVGQEHVHFIGTWEGEPQNWRMHPECAAVTDTRDGFTPGDFERPKFATPPVPKPATSVAGLPALAPSEEERRYAYIIQHPNAVVCEQRIGYYPMYPSLAEFLCRERQLSDALARLAAAEDAKEKALAEVEWHLRSRASAISSNCSPKSRSYGEALQSALDMQQRRAEKAEAERDAALAKNNA